MMEDEEECDELPPITVNSSGRVSSGFAMPCAVELAAQRARELATERELAAERERYAAAALHSDSSGSEGEAALAAAAGALRLQAAARAAAPPRLAELLSRAARHLPAPAAAALLRLARASPAAACLRRVHDWLDGPERAEDEECAVGAWLCLATVAAERHALGPGAARAAQRLLDAAPATGRALEPALLAAAAEPRARLRLADALRAGGARGDALAERLAHAALADLLALPPDPTAEEWEAGAVRWRRLDAAERYVALQLAARARAWAAPDAGAGPARLLAALAAAPPPARDHSPDALKVLVAASKLRVLFPVKK